jgi:hypothetical protein
MIDFQISAKGKLSVFRICPKCDAYLIGRAGEGSNLRQNQFLKQKLKLDGSWYHTSPGGRCLHKISTRRKE